MNFDKTKAMRAAERHVAQGKIRAAIYEYRAVVDNDPRDIGTLNMLGDLYVKNSEKREAVDCYMLVAEHYSKQGFAQKAIAVYNKITRLQPESIEVSTKLAELYTVKGSLSEARAHYTTLAEHYEKNGRRLEALSMWKQIALLDPNNTDVCMSLGDSFLREGHRDDAAEAFAEAGARFGRQGKHEEAIRALMKGHDIRPGDLRILDGLVKAYSGLGRVGKAVSLLEEILEAEPYNRDVLYLLIDCHIDSQNAAGAEKAVLKLVEIEPANYPKLLDLIRIYLNANDPDSAARILSMSSEYLLAAGQGSECSRWINEILERDPQHVAALRLLVHYCSWLRDESAYSTSLVRLTEAAKIKGAVEDERFALSHLAAIRPLDASYAERLAEINEQHGFEAEPVDEELVRAQFRGFGDDDEAKPAVVNENSGFQTASDLNGHAAGNGHSTDFAMAGDIVDNRSTDRDQVEGLETFHNVEAVESVEAVAEDDMDEAVEVVEPEITASELDHSDDGRMAKEIESIAFYIDNDYRELAEKALDELKAEFGESPEIDALYARLAGRAEEHITAQSLGIDQIRSEFGLAENDLPDEGDDYDTHYQMGIAYQEMGLAEEAIKEYQDAINRTRPDDGTRRFFQCANLLGHCFMQSSMGKHAVTWFNRALETPDLGDDEQQGIWYELALAYQADGDDEHAARYFEQVYAENVDYRDVAERIKSLAVQH